MEKLDAKNISAIGNDKSVSKIFINVEGNINGLSKDQIDSLITALRSQSAGYNYLKGLPFSKQKETFYQLKPELKKLSNSEFIKEVEKDLQQGKDCEDILVALEIWKKEQAEKAELAALNK